MATSLLATAFEPHYQVERELGRGGMATVYLARDLRHDRWVAIKVLHPSLATALGPDRFTREIHVAAQLHHPHILPVFDSGRVPSAEGEALLWYAMPFVEGESLRGRLELAGALPLTAALRITREVAEALDYAHRRGVVHRDIKPENILLQDGQAVVADFGIARPIAPATGGHITLEGIILGTPAYVSPEQALGSPELDGRSDLYSLGCVLFEMLTGEPLFVGRTIEGIIKQRLGNQERLLSRLPPTVPPHVRAVLTRMLARQPADRPETGMEVAGALIEHPSTASVAVVPPEHHPPHLPSGVRAIAFGVVFAALSLAAVGVGVRSWLSQARPVVAPVPRTIVVLPFTNLGQPDDEYFADGLTDEIAGRLARVPGIRVIARSSAMAYKGTSTPPTQIGKALGAGYALEGSVRWERSAGGESRIRVTPRLVDLGSSAYLWADQYDAEPADVFAVQGNIAKAVVEALDLRLRTDQRQALAEQPTANLDAYGAYLRGNEYLNHAWGSEPNLRLALQMYERATELDSNFAPAFAKLSRAQSQMFWHYYDHTNGRLARAKAAAERAIRLQPGLGEGHLALGLYWYWGYRDYARAVEQFTLADREQPNNPDIVGALGALQRRQGRWEEAVANLRRAAELDPLNSGAQWEVGVASLYLRRYAEAERDFDRALAIAPDYGLAHSFKAMNYVLWQGDTARARRAIETGIQQASLGQLVSYLGAARWLLTSDTSKWVTLDSLSAAALQDDTTYYYVWKVEWNRERHRPALMHVYGDSARAAVERQLAEHPDDAMLHEILAVASGGMNRKAAAIAEAELAANLLPLSKDAYWGADRRTDLALTYTLFGEPDQALDQLEVLLRVPAAVSAPWLRLDPSWKPLWGLPRFRQLTAARAAGP